MLATPVPILQPPAPMQHELVVVERRFEDPIQPLQSQSLSNNGSHDHEMGEDEYLTFPAESDPDVHVQPQKQQQQQQQHPDLDACIKALPTHLVKLYNKLLHRYSSTQNHGIGNGNGNGSENLHTPLLNIMQSSGFPFERLSDELVMPLVEVTEVSGGGRVYQCRICAKTPKNQSMCIEHVHRCLGIKPLACKVRVPTGTGIWEKNLRGGHRTKANPFPCAQLTHGMDDDKDNDEAPPRSGMTKEPIQNTTLIRPTIITPQVSPTSQQTRKGAILKVQAQPPTHMVHPDFKFQGEWRFEEEKEEVPAVSTSSNQLDFCY
ncbi:hypothetical protein FRC17_007286 [Serendipita sp. 399]|nr:hypothetical protein FRC17_007286 [Serendipita sp. 399]